MAKTGVLLELVPYRKVQTGCMYQLNNLNLSMKTKMSLKNIKDVLSREEMRGIMAGSGCSIHTCKNANGTTNNCYSSPHHGLACKCVKDSTVVDCGS